MIEIRQAAEHEARLGCNTCSSKYVEVVVELGNRRSTYTSRLCKACFIHLKHVADEVAGWDIFRDEW